MREQIVQTQNWIRRVQRSSDKTKKIWLVILSGFAMIFIIGVWFLYIEFTLPKLKGTAEETKKEEEPFWRTFGEGARVIGERMWGEIRGARQEFADFKNAAEKKINNFSNDFTIEGQ